tara:strand:+ start:3871 stop:4533 length:663 start_codon:yes stop_codon:yes gene_type:complete
MTPNNTSQSDARTIAMLRRQLEAAQACLIHYKYCIVEMREFVKDTDIGDEDDVVLSNNFVIEKCQSILSTNVDNIHQINEQINDSDEEMPDLISYSDEETDDEETDDEEMPDLISDSDEETDDEETDEETDDEEMDVDYENLNDYIANYGQITIDGEEYFIDDGNYTGHVDLLMLYDTNGDLEPIGTYIPNDDSIIYEAFGYSHPITNNFTNFTNNSVLI